MVPDGASLDREGRPIDVWSDRTGGATTCRLPVVAGVFIAFEGIDGSGKSTQVERAVAWMRSRSIEPLQLREPGGTALGERIRDLLLDHSTGAIAPAAEALLYAASRAELFEQVVRPALTAGRVVVADRFVDSSLAYQGAGRGLGIDLVRAANDLALAGARPDLTVLVRVSADVAARRLAAAGGEADRIEVAGADFFARVADAYDRLAAADPARYAVVDGAGSVDDVHAATIAAIEPRLAALAAAQGAGA